MRPAFDVALRRHDAEVAAIAAAEPSWENTVEALERSGRDIERVMSYFANLLGTDSTPEMQELAAELSRSSRPTSTPSTRTRISTPG